MKIFQYNSMDMGQLPYGYDISPADLYDKFDIKVIYLAYHEADGTVSTQSTGNMGMSGVIEFDSLSFYYFIFEQDNGSEIRLTFNLPVSIWELSEITPDDPLFKTQISERLDKLEKQQAINLIEFMDLFGT